nr:Rho-associated protein kinase [Ipomoea batatas]
MTRPDSIMLQRGQGKNKEKMVSSKRTVVLIGLGLAMLMGLAIYMRLWTIQYRISTDETELIRKQFDLANREAMDESAYWRSRFDDEAGKVSNCQKELLEIKQSSGVEGTGMNSKLESLRKENMDLLEKIESLKQELGLEKLKCSMKQPKGVLAIEETPK